MEIHVETLTGTSFDMRVFPQDTVLNIKNRIQRVEGRIFCVFVVLVFCFGCSCFVKKIEEMLHVVVLFAVKLLNQLYLGYFFL